MILKEKRTQKGKKVDGPAKNLELKKRSRQSSENRERLTGEEIFLRGSGRRGNLAF